MPANAPARLARRQNTPATNAGKNVDPAIENADVTTPRMSVVRLDATAAAASAAASSKALDKVTRRVREAECFDGVQVRLLDDGAPSVEVRASGPGSALLPLDPDAP